jgi:16S rRNA processing protein RimM
MPLERLLVGQFGAAHGVKGEVRLKSFTQDPQAIGCYGPLFDRHGVRTFVIAGLRPLKDDLFVARLEGISTRAGAEALAGIELYVPRAVLPPPQDEEFYFADLIGLLAANEAGETIGPVVQVLNYGAGDMLEIAPRAGGETLLVPFTKAAVPHVDLAAGELVVSLPDAIEASPETENSASG